MTSLGLAFEAVISMPVKVFIERPLIMAKWKANFATVERIVVSSVFELGPNGWTYDKSQVGVDRYVACVEQIVNIRPEK